MHFLNLIPIYFAALSGALGLWQWFAARKFPLHRKIAVLHFTPAISILKPVKGADDTTRESLQSWFRQNYSGPVEILFGVADENDSACEIIRHLITENPGVNARLVVCAPLKGANAKAAKLAQLEKLAQHDLILISDADVRVPPEFISNFVAPLRDENIALVNCFYRLANPVNHAMRLESIAINADFWSQVLQAATLKPLDFALGAAILVRRKPLENIGGFESLADCLADDYQLGNRIAKKGNQIALCPVVVECWDPPMTWTQVWKHQLRWARTIRVCQPAPYFFSILNNATFWPLLWLALDFTPQVFATVVAFILARILIAQDLQNHLSPGKNLVSPAWLIPVKDLLHAGIWFSAFVGNTVEWRGNKMKLRRDGSLIPCPLKMAIVLPAERLGVEGFEPPTHSV